MVGSIFQGALFDKSVRKMIIIGFSEKFILIQHMVIKCQFITAMSMKL